MDRDSDRIERMCELCEYYLFNDSVNTNQFNMCEGSRCDEAEELLEEEEEEQRITKRENKIDELLDS